MSAALGTFDFCSTVAREASAGLTSLRKNLLAWLFYDAQGTLLFEKITRLLEYYKTRTERDLLLRHSGKKMKKQLLPGNQRLIGADLVKSEGILVPAHDDADKVTAAFNLNILLRLNREVGTNFDLRSFEHLAVWSPLEKRIEMHLESQLSQHVNITGFDGGADVTVHFAAGETIHTENSYKFTTSTLSAQLVEAGFMT
jgi:uncharacterized SAM-dependent methyltransferase